MRKHLFTIVIILVFLTGLSVLLYPYVSSYINSINQSRAVAQYYKDMEYLVNTNFSEWLEAAHEYNAGLLKKTDRFRVSEEELEQYKKLLDPTGKDVMGTLEFDVINVLLPIYHGTSEGVLQVGLGHLEGSSLPVGGLGTHAVITGHRGLPSSTLLTDLDKIVIGDIFVLQILNETLSYQVDQILVVKPDDISALAIDTDKDYCTLVTCTPYGINSHRMLVRGHRITNDTTTSEDKLKLDIPSEAVHLSNMQWLIFALVPAAIIVFGYLLVRIWRTHSR